jgi:hypothetical protein
MLYKNTVRTSKRTPHFTITKINWLTLFKFKGRSYISFSCLLSRRIELSFRSIGVYFPNHLLSRDCFRTSLDAVCALACWKMPPLFNLSLFFIFNPDILNVKFYNVLFTKFWTGYIHVMLQKIGRSRWPPGLMPRTSPLRYWDHGFESRSKPDVCLHVSVLCCSV